MLQSFAASTSPDQGPPRINAVREAMQQAGVVGFLVPRADAHQGEYVAPRDERLAWLTGFTGSAGFCVVLQHTVGLFVDGRYSLQAAAQTDPTVVTTVPWAATELSAWLAEQLPSGGTIGFDPWLHSAEQIDKLRTNGEKSGLTYQGIKNILDSTWVDQPPPPSAKVTVHPDSLAGAMHSEKRQNIARSLTDAGESAALITLPDSIAWLLNIRGGDIARIPVAHAFALVHKDAHVDLFIESAKVDDAVRVHLGADIRIAEPSALIPHLQAMEGKVRVDEATAPLILRDALSAPSPGKDPCSLPKACKTKAELSGSRAAHLRDGVALAHFLHWVETKVSTDAVTEIDVVKALEGFRAKAPELRDISFETIAGAGPNGAVVHYRVTEETNRTIAQGDLLLVDSGGQYADGTTDVTRTLATGPVSAEQCKCFTRVLKGMIGISRLRWPKGLAGRDLDAVARVALWEAGLDYDHGTGHGVGAYLSVHEGPHGLSRRATTPFEPGMIVSNEPGYYRAGDFGIRIENLVVVVPAPALDGADDREMLSFETLTWAPIDKRLITVDLLSEPERNWLNTYHSEVLSRIGPHVSGDVSSWLETACTPL